MHPAPSVIIFTTFSGLGFGLLFWLGLGAVKPTGFGAFIWFFIAYAMAVGGLLASTFHLGHPERALKAFSQWRSSWLSREGIAAVATVAIMAIYALGALFGVHMGFIGFLGAIGAIATVFTTSMIYAQLKTVPRWKHWTTPALFLTLSLGGGALFAGQITETFLLFVVATALQGYAWITGDTRLETSGTDLKTATGLGSIGEVRAFEPPHTGTNYLMREFIHVVGRKHAEKLRMIGLGLAFILPVFLLNFHFHHMLGLLAVLSHVAGVLTIRWLFFAEAEHVVGLYYGKR
jgi:DMSO reductase anchor subunit